MVEATHLIARLIKPTTTRKREQGSVGADRLIPAFKASVQDGLVALKGGLERHNLRRKRHASPLLCADERIYLYKLLNSLLRGGVEPHQDHRFDERGAPLLIGAEIRAPLKHLKRFKRGRIGPRLKEGLKGVEAWVAQLL
jgi:hypothetical protein